MISFTGILIFNFLLAAYLKSLIEDSQAVIDSFKNSYEILDTNGDAGSGFSNKGINFSTTGILLQSPGSYIYNFIQAIYLGNKKFDDAFFLPGILISIISNLISAV